MTDKSQTTTEDQFLLAANRIRHYVEMRQAKPIRQSDDCIHGIHTGTRWEAELLLSDLQTVLEALP